MYHTAEESHTALKYTVIYITHPSQQEHLNLPDLSWLNNHWLQGLNLRLSHKEYDRTGLMKIPITFFLGGLKQYICKKKDLPAVTLSATFSLHSPLLISDRHKTSLYLSGGIIQPEKQQAAGTAYPRCLYLFHFCTLLMCTVWLYVGIWPCGPKAMSAALLLRSVLHPHK